MAISISSAGAPEFTDNEQRGMGYLRMVIILCRRLKLFEVVLTFEVSM